VLQKLARASPCHLRACGRCGASHKKWMQKRTPKAAFVLEFSEHWLMLKVTMHFFLFLARHCPNPRYANSVDATILSRLYLSLQEKKQLC